MKERTMEYRVWITLTELPLDDEARWEAFIGGLEEHVPELGPVISWTDDRAQLTMATEAGDEAVAVAVVVDAIVRVVHETGLLGVYPCGFEVEPISSQTEVDELVPA